MPSASENPFKVPDRYFDELHGKVMARIMEEPEEKERESTGQGKKIYLRPYFALAASISGVALIIYILLQTMAGVGLEENGAYDLATLDLMGIMQDESVLIESYTGDEVPDFTEWEEEAIFYLSSNEVDLIHLLGSE